MLSFDEVKNLVIKNLDSLDPNVYQVVRDDPGQTTQYTITLRQSGKLLGRYRVGKRPDGGVDYGSIQGDSPQWDLVWESMLNRTLFRADGRMTEAMEQDFQRRQDTCLRQIQENNAAQARAAEPEMQESNDKTVRVSEKTEALNKLAVMWVRFNQKERISKDDDMEWFIDENAKAVGLEFLTVNEFKKHLPKACKAQIIDKDKRTGRFIPKLAT